MDAQQFWKLIEAAQRQAADPTDAWAVAARAIALLSARPRDEILAAHQALWALMAASYRSPLWAAVYVINGGCSDDGFEYFRGWLIAQGRQVYERTVADPDTLADLPVIQAKAPRTWPMECEDTLRITSEAYRAATGEEFPPRALTTQYPELDPAWDFDFDDQTEMTRRLPRLTALFVY